MSERQVAHRHLLRSLHAIFERAAGPKGGSACGMKASMLFPDGSAAAEGQAPASMRDGLRCAGGSCGNRERLRHGNAAGPPRSIKPACQQHCFSPAPTGGASMQAGRPCTSSRFAPLRSHSRLGDAAHAHPMITGGSITNPPMEAVLWPSVPRLHFSGGTPAAQLLRTRGGGCGRGREQQLLLGAPTSRERQHDGRGGAMHGGWVCDGGGRHARRTAGPARQAPDCKVGRTAQACAS